jgi:hypothetical protein
MIRISIDDKKSESLQPVVSERSSQRWKTENGTHFSFSILVLNPSGLATMTSQL